MDLALPVKIEEYWHDSMEMRFNEEYTDMEFNEYQDMVSRFNERTRRHIGLVQKYGIKICEKDQFFYQNFLPDIMNHDWSKFSKEEFDGYVLINHHYFCKQNKIYWKPTDYEKKMMEDASLHHITHNPHHPEFHDPLKGMIGSDNPVGTDRRVVDARTMGTGPILEMVSDWLAMSEELNNDPFEWADKVIPKKFVFDPAQVDFIYRMLHIGWN